MGVGICEHGAYIYNVMCVRVYVRCVYEPAIELIQSVTYYKVFHSPLSPNQQLSINYLHNEI